MGPIWLLVILTIPVVLGLLLTFRGWRGRRIDDHPLCRKCGYDLVASAHAANCPECGHDLTQPHATRIGHRRKRKVSLAIGVLLLLATAGGGGALGVAAARGFDFTPYKPLWMLKREANDPLFATAWRAKAEILNRLSTGRLSHSQVDGIVQPALKVQGDRNAAWQDWWGDFIEQAWKRGDVSDATITQYARCAVENAYWLRIGPKLRQGSMAWVYVMHSPMRAGSSGTLWCETRNGPIKLEDGTTLAGGGGVSQGSISGGSRGSSGFGTIINLPPGRHTATQDLRVRIGRAGRTNVTSFLSMGGGFGPSDDGGADGGNETKPDWVLAEFPMQLKATFDVVGADTEIVERVHDDSMKAAISRAATVTRCRAVDLSPQAVMAICEVQIDHPPIDVAFDVLLRIGEREWLVSTVAARSSEGPSGDDALAGDRILSLPMTSERMPGPLRDFPRDAERADVILRSSAKAAEEAGLGRMWDGEIVIRDVPIERPRRR